MNDELEYWKSKFLLLQEQLQNDVRYLVALKVSYYERFVPAIVIERNENERNENERNENELSKDELCFPPTWGLRGHITLRPKLDEISYIQQIDMLISTVTKEYDMPFREAISRIRACEQQLLGEKK